MALEMRAQGKAVRFEYHDDDASTVVALSPEDSQEALVRKLKRVIALVEGSAQALQQWAAGQETGIMLPTNPPQPGPWKGSLEPPVLPDRLKGTVEMEGAAPQPGNGWASLGGEG